MTRLFSIRSILFWLAIFTGCDSPLTGLEVQDIAEVQWRRDGSAMIGFVQNFVSNPNIADPRVAYQLTRIAVDGKIGASYQIDGRSISDFSYSIFVTADDRYAITQLAVLDAQQYLKSAGVYRIELASGAEQKLLSDFHLIAVSPDGRFLIGSHSPGMQPIKTLTVYDVNTESVRKVTAFDIDGLATMSGVWLNSGQFAVTVNDSVGYHIDIYDTLGVLRRRIGAARTPAHNVKFIPATNHLYFRANNGSIGMADLTNGSESQPIHFEVQNFDLSQEEKLLYYTVRNGDKLLLMKQDIETGSETQLADNVLWGVFLSPDEKKVAYIYEREPNFQEIRALNTQ